MKLAGRFRFVTVEEVRGFRFVGQFLEGERGADIGRDLLILILDLGGLAGDFVIDRRGFDGPGALKTPAGGYHFFD